MKQDYRILDMFFQFIFGSKFAFVWAVNPLNAEFNPICHLLELLGAHHILHASNMRVKARGE
jgi:hypothetical protein